MKIRYYNPSNPNEFYDLKQGWSWTLFLWWGCFGIPFFYRKMPLFAIGAIAFALITSFMANVAPAMAITISILDLGISWYLGSKGNEITREYLVNTKGWIPETQEQFSQRAGFSVPSNSTPNGNIPQ